MGEPKWLWTTLPHPAVLMGRAVGLRYALQHAGTKNAERSSLPYRLSVLAPGLLDQHAVAASSHHVAAILLAQKSLAQHVGNVASGLRMSVPEGQRQVSHDRWARHICDGCFCRCPRCHRECGGKPKRRRHSARLLVPDRGLARSAGLQNRQHCRQHDRVPHRLAMRPLDTARPNSMTCST